MSKLDESAIPSQAELAETMATVAHQNWGLPLIDPIWGDIAKAVRDLLVARAAGQLKKVSDT